MRHLVSGTGEFDLMEGFVFVAFYILLNTVESLICMNPKNTCKKGRKSPSAAKAGRTGDGKERVKS